MMLGKLDEAEKWLLQCEAECVDGEFHNSRAYLLLALGELMLANTRPCGDDDRLGRSQHTKGGLAFVEGHDIDLIRKAQRLFEAVSILDFMFM